MSENPKTEREVPDWAMDWVQLLPSDIPIRSPHVGQVRVYVPRTVGLVANAARAQLEYKMDSGEEEKRLRVLGLLPPLQIDSEPATQSVGQAVQRTDLGPSEGAAEPSPRSRKRRVKNSIRRLGGIQVQVFSEDALLGYGIEVEALASLKSKEYAKAARSLAEELLRRGTWRTVALDRQWKRRLEKLHEEMPSFAPVIQHVETCCSLSSSLRRPLRISPILLVGSPGVGKTRFATRLAEALGLPHYLYAMDSAETVATLSGSDKHWGNSEPGQLFRHVVLDDVANPLVVLDEIDKARKGSSDSSGYRPATALLSPLEPYTARTFRDKSADLVFDASHVVYVATANLLSPIEDALLSRFTIFHIKEPDVRAVVSTTRSVIASVLRDLGLDKRFGTIKGEALQQLAMLRNPRSQRQILETAIGRAIADGRRTLRAEDLMTIPDLQRREIHRLM